MITKIKIHVILVLGLLSVGIFAGCATLGSGKTQAVSVSSNVDGAEIFLDGIVIGKTPFTGPVAKNKQQLRVEAAGYRTETITLSKSLDPLFWGNIIIGGTVGSITDFATGAAYQYAPASYQVELREEGMSEAAFMRQLGTRKMAMVYIDPIVTDLASGGGEYLNALIEISGYGDGDALSSEEVLEAMKESRGDRIKFGQLIVDSL
jgi:hypothetical protein